MTRKSRILEKEIAMEKIKILFININIGFCIALAGICMKINSFFPAYFSNFF